MNYQETVLRMDELQEELEALHTKRREMAQEETTHNIEFTKDNVSASITVNYETGDLNIIHMTKDDVTLSFTVEEYNALNAFLGQHTEIVFNFMSKQLAKENEDV